LIKSNIKINDKFSVVIDITYDKIFNRKKSKYTTLTYLFIPESLNINNKTYPETKFYNDVRLNVKYDTPNYKLEDLYLGEKSLLISLEKKASKFLENRTKKNKWHFTDQVKMFSATLSDLLSNETKELIKSKKINSKDIQCFLENITIILSDFRNLVIKIDASTLKEESKNIVFYSDEHISNSVELQLTNLYYHLQNTNNSNTDLELIANLINKEQKYKKHHNYDSPKDKSINPEDLIYKRNRLKNYIESIFYLNQNIRKDGVIFEQSILALAAGMAMIFSTAIAFYYQQIYGNFTIPFFGALVVSYMLKDRIKGSIGLLFISRSQSFFYDYKIKITNNLGKKVGKIKENYVFVPLNKLGNKIKKHRLKELILKLDINSLNEQVIQYKKKIVIYPKKFGDDLPDENIIGLTDITRLNFHRFIQYMDDPKKDYVLVKKGEVQNKETNKLYHINIIQKYYTEEGIMFNRYRVIMNRDGIKRIENIA